MLYVEKVRPKFPHVLVTVFPEPTQGIMETDYHETTQGTIETDYPEPTQGTLSTKDGEKLIPFVCN